MTTEELIDGLSRLAKIMGKAEFRDWSAWCRNAAEDLLRRKEVVVVKHTKYYSHVTDISAFWGKELAKKSLQASLNCRLEVLRDLGYTPTTIAGEAQYEINAADGNIYYEWEIESIPITEETEGEATEITSQYEEYPRFDQEHPAYPRIFSGRSTVISAGFPQMRSVPAAASSFS